MNSYFESHLLDQLSLPHMVADRAAYGKKRSETSHKNVHDFWDQDNLRDCSG